MQAVQDQRNSKLHCNQEKSVTDFWDKEMWLIWLQQSPYTNTHTHNVHSMDPKLGQ